MVCPCFECWDQSVSPYLAVVLTISQVSLQSDYPPSEFCLETSRVAKDGLDPLKQLNMTSSIWSSCPHLESHHTWLFCFLYFVFFGNCVLCLVEGPQEPECYQTTWFRVERQKLSTSWVQQYTLVIPAWKWHTGTRQAPGSQEYTPSLRHLIVYQLLYLLFNPSSLPPGSGVEQCEN